MAQNIVYQTDAVGVVAANTAVGEQNQRVYRAGGAGALGVLIHPIISIGFKRHGYIGAQTAFGKKSCRRCGKLLRLGQNAFVFDKHTFLPGKSEVDLRGFAVGNRVAKHGIARFEAHHLSHW